MKDLHEIGEHQVRMRHAPRPVVVTAAGRLAALVDPDLTSLVRLELGVARLVVQHRRHRRPAAAVDPDVRLGRAADHRFKIDVRRAHGGVVGPDVAAAGVVNERGDVRPAAGDDPRAARAAPGHHLRARCLRHGERAGADRPIARRRRVVDRRRLALFVHEQRDVLQPLGARERRRLEPLGVGDDGNAGAADGGQCRIAAGAHEHRRPAPDDELGVDDAGCRELADGAGRDAALHGVADEIAEARHAGQHLQPLQIHERHHLRRRTRKHRCGGHLDDLRAREIAGQRRRRRPALHEHVAFRRAAAVGAADGHDLERSPVLDAEVRGVADGDLVRKVVPSCVEAIDAAAGQIAGARLDGRGSDEDRRRRAQVEPRHRPNPIVYQSLNDVPCSG